MMRWFRKPPTASDADGVQLPQPPAEASAAQERERIYADLHDDIGAKLMELVHLTDDDSVRALAREALDDLRDIVSRTKAIEGSLLTVLDMIREEAQRRLHARGIEMVWDTQADCPDPALQDSEALHLFRIFREAISRVNDSISPCKSHHE